MRREVEKLIDEQQAGLLPMRIRTNLLRAVQVELELRCKGKPYFPWNDLVYRMLSDTKAMVFVMLSDWARTQVMPSKSLLTKLLNTDATVFRRRRDGHPSESRSAREEDDANHATAYDRVFPNARSRAQRKDLEGVKVRFETRMEVILKHRDKNIAHAREVTAKKEEARPAMLTVAAAVDALDYCDDLLNDLRGLLGGAYRSREAPITRAHPVLFAELLVDSLVLHPVLMEHRSGDRAKRIAVYEALHRLHDASGAKSPLFNEGCLTS